MKFDIVIGNPPYNNQMYRKFLDKVDTMLKDDGKFDLLFPVYIYTRSRCVDIFKSKLKLESVDMTPGFHFNHTVSGAWVVRIKGTKDVTDTFDLTYPDGTVEHGCTLDDVNPSSAIFIEDMVKKEKPGLLSVDRQIANRILDSSIDLKSHKTGPIPCDHFCYLSPVIRRMTQKNGDPFPGILHLRTMTTQSKDTQNGYYIECETQEEAERLSQMYGWSDLFVYLFYLVASDSIYADNFIKKLPKIDLRSDIVLSEDEVERINQVMK